MDTLPGWIHIHPPLDPIRHIHPCLCHLPLRTHLPQTAFPLPLLLGTRHQLRLLPWFSPRRLSYLPTNILPLQSLGQGWHMQTREEHGHVYWNPESCPRRCCGGHAHANPLAPQVVHPQEGCRE